MKILVVDDNSNNRMMLKLLLEDYAQKNSGCTFEIDEAQDGLQAIEKSSGAVYDLIFMDIMMPNMDGIAATARIRRHNKKTMIIAVSAVDDNERKKVILNNGAEDYISKPVNADIFSARLNSYLHLIQSRSHKKSVTRKAYTLYGSEVRSYHTRFYGEDEDMLSQFWEYYLLNDTPYDGISDMVRFIYDLGMEYVVEGKSVDIYEERNAKEIHITLVAPSSLDPDSIMEKADKNDFLENYKLKDNMITAYLKKEKVVNFIETAPKSTDDEKEESVEKPKESKSLLDAAKQITEVYNFLDPYDYEDLEEYISKLNSLLLLLSASDISAEEVDELIHSLVQIAKVMSGYSELYDLGMAMQVLAGDIKNKKDEFIQKSAELSPLAIAFGGDLSKWFKSLFIAGAPSVDFLDDSIISNAQMISSFLGINDHEEADDAGLDDIFDF